MVNLNLLHPWTKNAVQGFRRDVHALGGESRLISGFRGSQQQEDLCRSLPPGRPCAKPGCSQHQWGFAVDMRTSLPTLNRELMCQAVCVGLFPETGSAGRIQCFQSCQERSQGLVDEISTKWFLRRPLPETDPNHYQGYSTPRFTAWLRSFGVSC